MGSPLKATGSELDDSRSWVSPKRRGRRSAVPANEVIVSRQSGLLCEKGTFSKADRFGKLGLPPTASPVGSKFYEHSGKGPPTFDPAKSCSLGAGERGKVMNDSPMPKRVGPGAYDSCYSAKQLKSPLDGPEFCTTTMKVKLPSKLVPNVPKEMCHPGPRYNVRKDWEQLHEFDPQCSVDLLSRMGRHIHPEDRNETGPGSYEQVHNTIGYSASAPSLREASEPGGVKRHRKSTFGVAERFPMKNTSCSPNADMYYAHSKHLSGEDMMQHARTTTFGRGSKIDLANPYKVIQDDVSAATFDPRGGYGAAMKSSPGLDGFATRCESPVYNARTSPKKRGSSTGTSMRRLMSTTS